MDATLLMMRKLLERSLWRGRDDLAWSAPGMTAATDGVALIYAPQDLDIPKRPHDACAGVKEWAALPATDVTTRQNLVDWIGEVDTDIGQCNECRGLGEKECETCGHWDKCTACSEGLTRVPLDQRPHDKRSFRGGVYDAVYLDLLARALVGPVVHVGYHEPRLHLTDPASGVVAMLVCLPGATSTALDGLDLVVDRIEDS